MTLPSGIPYTRSDGLKNTATTAAIPVSIESLDPEQIQVVGHLADAMDALTPIYSKQSHPKTLSLLRRIEDAEREAHGSAREELTNYATLINMMVAPFDRIGGFGYAGDIPQRRPDIFRGLSDVVSPGACADPKAGIYPPDMTQEEFDALPERQRMMENSTVVRSEDGTPTMRVNEERFRRELAPAIRHLKKARLHVRDPRLAQYLDAKISELRTGNPVRRAESDIAWIQNTGDIDFIFGTAVETYIDGWKSIRGCAQGAVFLMNKEYDAITRQIRSLIPGWRTEVPWDRSKDGVSCVPQLKFVDVVRWNGGYDLFPRFVAAESLPSDTQLASLYGRVNLVFVNVKDTDSASGTLDLYIAEFLPREVARLSDSMRRIYPTMVAAHELGHSIGPVLPEEDRKRAFGPDGHALEEGRAEIFSMWALPRLRAAGVITRDDEIAGHYEMLLTCLNALTVPPKDHSAARNMMLHYFLETGAVKEFEDEGRLKYAIVQERIDDVVSGLLGRVGTLKTLLDSDGFRAFKAQYCLTDRQEEFKQRFNRFPYGFGAVFPELEVAGGRYTGKLWYPKDFRGQSRALSNFL